MNMNNDLISRAALLERFEQVKSKVSSLVEVVFFDGVMGMVDNAPAVDAEPVRHGRWEYVKKHLWHRDKNGEVDMWYLDHGFHNGPGCEVCGLSVCEHCKPDWAEQECEVGYFVCSLCGQATKQRDTAYCPNCGAKMDGDRL